MLSRGTRYAGLSLSFCLFSIIDRYLMMRYPVAQKSAILIYPWLGSQLRQSIQHRRPRIHPFGNPNSSQNHYENNPLHPQTAPCDKPNIRKWKTKSPPQFISHPSGSHSPSDIFPLRDEPPCLRTYFPPILHRHLRTA